MHGIVIVGRLWSHFWLLADSNAKMTGTEYLWAMFPSMTVTKDATTMYFHFLL